MSGQAAALVGYCGLNCAECFNYNKTVSEASKNLRRELRAARLKDSWGDVPWLGEYESFKKTLDGLAKLRCNDTCKGGSGNPWCAIRKCCQKKGIEGCWECPDTESCSKQKEMYLKNVRRIKKVGIDAFMRGKK